MRSRQRGVLLWGLEANMFCTLTLRECQAIRDTLTISRQLINASISNFKDEEFAEWATDKRVNQVIDIRNKLQEVIDDVRELQFSLEEEKA